MSEGVISAVDLITAAPEIVLLILACVVLVVDVYVGTRYKNLTYNLGQASVVIVAVLCIGLSPESTQLGFSGTFVKDPMSSLLKVFMLLIGYYAFFYMNSDLRQRGIYRGEYIVLGLFSLLGMMVLVSAASLITVYLGLELLSLCLYAMVALDRDNAVATEAAMKYFVLGALASGMLLYGMSLIYGVCGSLSLNTINTVVSAERVDNKIVLTLGIVMMLVGIAFKLGAAPFHMWVPDVYQGAATPITLFIGTAPKIAAFGMLIRLLVDGMGAMHEDWQGILTLLAILSMGVGNLIAIAQTNLKRMLAYSTVAHVGFLFLGMIAGSEGGYAGSMFYSIAYATMALCAFGLIVSLAHVGFESDTLDDIKGLNSKSQLHALIILIVMLSMAGVPPFFGFWAKWFVLMEVVRSGHEWLAVVGVLFSVVGLFYYLRVVVYAYFHEPVNEQPVLSRPQLSVMVSSNALVIILMGVLFPGALMALCLRALGG